MCAWKASRWRFCRYCWTRRGSWSRDEELRKKLWPEDTFVDFEHSLNAAVKRLRAALNDSADQPRYIETLSRRGYRFMAHVNRASDEVVAVASDVAPTLASTQAPSAVGDRRLWLIAVAVCVVAVVTWGWRQWRHRSATPTTSAIRSLAVLPLENLSGDPSQEYLADGMTEELIGRLSMIHDLRVISRTSVMHFKNTQLSVPDIAKTLGVDAIVEGSVIREGNRIRVHAQLIRGATDEHLWAESYDRELPDALALESDVAQAVAAKVEVTVTGKERARLAAARPVAFEAFESNLKGWFVANNKTNSRADIEESIRYFQEAIKIDPTYALPYLGLGVAYMGLGSNMIGDSPQEAHAKAMTAAQKALELDPDLAGAHVLLGEIRRKQYQWAQAKAEYERALELNAHSPDPYFALAEWFSVQGRAGEALTWAQRGREVDPLSPSGDDMGLILYHARRYDEAIEEYRGVLAVLPDEANSLWSIGIVLMAKHQAEQAIPVLEMAVSVSNRSPGIIGSLVMAYAQAGRRIGALRLLAELKKHQQPGYAGAFVNAYLGLGDYDQAFFWLEQAYRQQANPMQRLKVDPIFDPVRDDPRFKDLVHRVGLDKSY